MDLAATFEELGVSGTESALYLSLLRYGSLSAGELADRSAVTRPTVYSVTRSLIEKGLVETGAGYGRRFRPIPPDRAVSALVARQRDALSERERRSKDLIRALADTRRAPAMTWDGEIAEILRTPRLVTERLSVLAGEAREEIDFFVKAPLVSTAQDDPDMVDALGRGVRIRSVYEAGILRDPGVQPYLESWMAAGEDARMFDGRLPMKMALFDARVALLPLETPGERSGLTSIIIRHQGIGEGMRIMFESIWRGSDRVQRQ